MSRVGKIILDTNYPNPRVIISDEGHLPKTLELVKNTKDLYPNRIMKLNEQDIIRLNYRGKKIIDRSVDLTKVSAVHNLKIREIGVLTEAAYCKLLKTFMAYHVYEGANSISYLSVREDVQKQLIKLLDMNLK